MRKYKAISKSEKLEDIQIQVSETVTNILSTKTVAHVDAEIAALQEQIQSLQDERVQLLDAARLA